MFKISRTTPAYYFTSVTHHRLPIFRTDKLKQIFCDAIREVRLKHGILILAYVIMPDHVHLLVYSKKEISDALRLLNGISARRIIQYLKTSGFEGSLFQTAWRDTGAKSQTLGVAPSYGFFGDIWRGDIPAKG